MVLPGLGEHGQRTLTAARLQKARRRVCVVARLDGDVEHFFEGVTSRLAILELDDVEDLGGVVDDEVVKAQHDGGALGERTPRPPLLRCARRRACGGHVIGRALRHASEELAAERRLDGDGLRGRRHGGARREAFEQRRAHARRPLPLHGLGHVGLPGAACHDPPVFGPAGSLYQSGGAAGVCASPRRTGEERPRPRVRAAVPPPCSPPDEEAR